MYGPVQERGPGYEASSLIGRILGMLVVAAAVGVLGVGALTVLGDGDRAAAPESSPTAPALAGATDSPTLAATVPPAPTVPPTTAPATQPTPTPDTTAQPTVGTTPVELEVREGPGYVTFGTESNASLRITNARTTFGLDERITWSAHLTSPANSVDLRTEVSKIDPETGAEELVREDEVRPRVNGAQIFLRRLRADRAFDGPGTYVVRYLRGSTVMAEGAFEVEP